MAHGAFVLGLMFRLAVATRYARRTTVDGCKACAADVKFGKRVKVNIERVIGIAFTCLLDFACLELVSVIWSQFTNSVEKAYIVLEFWIRASVNELI